MRERERESLQTREQVASKGARLRGLNPPARMALSAETQRSPLVEAASLERGASTGRIAVISSLLLYLTLAALTKQALQADASSAPSSTQLPAAAARSQRQPEVEQEVLVATTSEAKPVEANYSENEPSGAQVALAANLLNQTSPNSLAGSTQASGSEADLALLLDESGPTRHQERVGHLNSSNQESAEQQQTSTQASPTVNLTSQVPKSGSNRHQEDVEQNVIKAADESQPRPSSSGLEADKRQAGLGEPERQASGTNSSLPAESQLSAGTSETSRPNVGPSSSQATPVPSRELAVSKTEASRVAPDSTERPGQTEVEFTPEMLQDHSHETDKLRHRPRPEGQSSFRFPAQLQPKQQAVAATKLETGNWLPASERQPHRGSSWRGSAQDTGAPTHPSPFRQRQRQQQQQQQQQRYQSVRFEPDLQSLDEFADDQVEGAGALDGASFLVAQNGELSYQSSLQPKHVPPPFVPDEHAHPQDQWAGLVRAPQTTTTTAVLPTRLNVAVQKGRFFLPSSRFVLHHQLKQSDPQAAAPAQSENPKQHLISSLKAKSFGLLPRLAAKLFNTQAEKGAEVLNQQHSFQTATHNSPHYQHHLSTGSGLSGKAGKLFPKGQLVKSLFSREPQSKGAAGLLPLAGSRRPNAEQTSTQASRPLNLPQSRLVLMNGQVYSVLSGQQPEASVNSGASGGAASGAAAAAAAASKKQADKISAIFDHQTSDTSEFPVFEAMGAQHMMAPSASMGSTRQASQQQAVSSASLRCDRPRHVIQADRAVVNHILQSQQNFVIARVPIKKYVRPEVSAARAPSHVYHAFPVPMAAAMSAPGPVGPNAGFGFATNRAPVFQPPATSIEVSASVPRQSIWQSLANLVSSLRYGSRRPELQAASLVASSSPPAVFVDGPLILAAARRLQQQEQWRRQRRRRQRRQRRLDLQDARRAGGQLALGSGAVFLREQSYFQPEQQIDSFGLASASAPPGAHYSEAAFAASGAQAEQVDPMRRLLMLKTATEEEVCSPVSQMDSKIKYSCVPNYCVVLALANSTNAASQSAQVNSNVYFKGSSSMQEYSGQRGPIEGKQVNQGRPLNETGGQHVQVQQFDDLPNQGPMVTYTHLNAYNPPVVSRLSQPQHQQFVTTSQALDALANNEISLGEDSAEELGVNIGPTGPNELAFNGQAVVYQPFGQASNVPVDQNTGLLYMQYPGGGARLAFARGNKRPASGRLASTGRPTSSPSGKRPASSLEPTVTFGTAYIETSPMPMPMPERTNSEEQQDDDQHEPSVERPRARTPTAEAEGGGRSKRPAAGSLNLREETRIDHYGPALTEAGEPNEFLSAVDEKLERPIRVLGRRRRKRKRIGPSPWAQKAGLVGVENGGSSAENSLIENAAPRLRHYVYNHGDQRPALEQSRAGSSERPLGPTGRQQRRRANGPHNGWAGGPTYVNRGANFGGQHESRLRPSKPPGPSNGSSGGYGGQASDSAGNRNANDGSDDGDEDDDNAERDEEEEADGREAARPDYDQSATEPERPSKVHGSSGELERPQAHWRRQTTKAAHRRPLVPSVAPITQQAVNVSNTIPIVDGRAVYGAEPLQGRERKTRRDNQATNGTRPPTTGAPTQGPLRYGLRQSTPLPPPERSDEVEPPVGGATNDDEPNPSTDSDLAGPSSTECDCANSTLPTGLPAAGYAIGARFNDTQQPPAAQLRGQNSSVRATPKRNPTTLKPNTRFAAQKSGQSELLLAKDRRQIEPASGEFSNGSVRYSTKRPYNLRNTTYKNLMQSNSGQTGASDVVSQLPPSGSSASSAHTGSPAEESPSLAYNRADISTTTALSVAAEAAAAKDEQANRVWRQGGGPTSSLATDDERRHSANNQTQFDDSYSEEPAARHYLAEEGRRASADELGGEARLAAWPVGGGANGSQAEWAGSGASGDGGGGSRARETGGGGEGEEASTSAPFRPASVNDILAQARRESGLGAGQSAQGAQLRPAPAKWARAHRASGNATSRGKGAANQEAGAESEDEGAEAKEEEEEEEATPHQYQIQLRWSNSSSAEANRREPQAAGPASASASASASGARQAKGLEGGEQGLEVDKMGERVRDRLFEHREEEHWHDKRWLRGGSKRKLVAGKWVLVPMELGARKFDYGPEGSERETPIGGQLAHEPSKEETAKHFAIPTPNFRQSAKFVDWVLKDVDMGEEPGEPRVESARPAAAQQQQQQQQQPVAASSAGEQNRTSERRLAQSR